MLQDGQYETAVNDHQYFTNAMVSPSSSSVLFSSSSNSNFDFESILQPATGAQLFPSHDAANVQQYLRDTPLAIEPAGSSEATSACSPNGMVPASPALNFDPEFPQLADDILQQALQSLGDLSKFAEDATAPPASASDVIGFDLLQSDDYVDLAWEESFEQLFPSLT